MGVIRSPGDELIEESFEVVRRIGAGGIVIHSPGNFGGEGVVWVMMVPVVMVEQDDGVGDGGIKLNGKDVKASDAIGEEDRVVAGAELDEAIIPASLSVDHA